MSEFLAVIEGIAHTGEGNEGAADKSSEGADKKGEEEMEIDEKELEDQVNDLVEIRKKDVLKKNLMNLVRENLQLKQKIKILESKLETQTAGNDSFNLLFRIDNEGEEDTEPQDIPISQSSLILTDSQEEPVVVEVAKKGGGNRCFNCLGDHMIAECPLPRNPREINKNKKEFQNKMMNAPRYHVDENQKFGHLRPGLPSAKLRAALRLREDQVPEYIYRMRALGYPPGWLLHARIDSSGINLYHDRGQKVEEAGEEDGEVVDDKDKVQYDIEKLVEWPGFNSSLPAEFKDETNKYRAVNLSRTQLLKDMIKELKPKEQKAYVRGKMQDTSVIEESNDTIVLDSTIELDCSDHEMEDRSEKEDHKDGVPEKTTSEMSTPSRQSSTSSNSVSKTEPGTPIVEIFSPFVKLPSQIDFAKDMSEHVAFENLPNYTGKWEEMRGLLKRIRKREEVAEKEEAAKEKEVPKQEDNVITLDGVTT